MEDDGIPTFAIVIALAAVIIGIVVAMAVITWVFILAAP